MATFGEMISGSDRLRGFDGEPVSAPLGGEAPAAALPVSSGGPRQKAAGLFDHLLPMAEASEGAGASIPTPAPPPATAKPGLFDHLLTEARPQESGLSWAGSVAADMAQAAGAGIIKGAAGMIDAPQAIYGGLDWLAEGPARGISNVARSYLDKPLLSVPVRGSRRIRRAA